MYLINDGFSCTDQYANEITLNTMNDRQMSKPTDSLSGCGMTRCLIYCKRIRIESCTLRIVLASVIDRIFTGRCANRLVTLYQTEVHHSTKSYRSDQTSTEDDSFTSCAAGYWKRPAKILLAMNT